MKIGVNDEGRHEAEEAVRRRTGLAPRPDGERQRQDVPWALKPGTVIVYRPDQNARVLDRRKEDGTGWWLTDGSGLDDKTWHGWGAINVTATIAEVKP